jgi:hypothetical protein
MLCCGDRSWNANCLKRTPFFGNNFVSGTDKGRDKLNRTHSWLGRDRNYRALSSISRTILNRKFAVGPDSISELIMGDLRIRIRESPSSTHATRGSVAKTPYFLETISCLALILGEMGDSGRDSGFRWTWKEADNPQRISGELLGGSQIRDQG